MVLGAGLAAGVTSAVIALRVLDGIPHVSDAIAYAYQAKIFASGRLFAPAPVPGHPFSITNIIMTPDHWYAMYPPGWPLLLAVGWWVGALWVVGPVLLGLAVVGAGQLGRRLFDDRTGAIAAVALATSPFALMMGAGFMAHTPTLCVAVWCMVCLAAGAESGRRGSLVGAGLLGGLALLVRPYTAVALLWPMAAWCLARRYRGGGPTEAARGLGWLALGVLPGVGLLLAHQWIFFGSPLRTGYQVYAPGWSFGGPGGEATSAAARLAAHLPWYVEQLNDSLWGWPWPDLLVLLPLAWPLGEWRACGRDAVLGACVLALVGAYGLYHYADVVYGGPRFAFAALAPISVLAARSLVMLYERSAALVSRRSPPYPRSFGRGAVVLAAGLLLAGPLLDRLPRQIRWHGQWYHGQSADLLAGMESAGVGEEAVVFIAGKRFVYDHLLLANELDPWRGKHVFIRDFPSARTASIARVPYKEAWQLRAVMVPLEGPNDYIDRWQPRRIEWRRLKSGTAPE